MFRFFLRKRLGFTVDEPKWLVAHAVNLDETLFSPVANGMWKQHELWDGTYTLDDLWDAIELLGVKAENERRSIESMKN